MNPEIRDLLDRGNRAARDGENAAAREAFIEAGLCASSHGMWRAAARCYRSALELDLHDREIVARIVPISGRRSVGQDWIEYARALELGPSWPAFGCRSAQIVLGDLGGVVTCQGVGPVLELIMARDDLVDVHPDGRFAGMPLAMAMVIMRRALWPAPVEDKDSSTRSSMFVTFAGGRRVCLDELGDWLP